MHTALRFWRIYVIIAIALADALVWTAVADERPTDHVTVAFLDVGQGDAIFIESPWRNQLIVDGGPPHRLLGALRGVMPFYDRSVDAILVTNPDADHYSGFLDLLPSFEVAREIEPGTRSSTERYEELERDVAAEGAERILARRGMVVHLGGGADLRVLFPDRDVSQSKTNDGSIVAELVYGSSTVMLTGDAPQGVERYLVSLYGTGLRSDILKVGHHGSRTSTSDEFVKAVDPTYAVISAGCKNSYGHPHKETLDTLAKEHVDILTTCTEGTIAFELDGKGEQRVR